MSVFVLGGVMGGVLAVALVLLGVTDIRLIVLAALALGVCVGLQQGRAA